MWGTYPQIFQIMLDSLRGKNHVQQQACLPQRDPGRPVSFKRDPPSGSILCLREQPAHAGSCSFLLALVTSKQPFNNTPNSETGDNSKPCRALLRSGVPSPVGQQQHLGLCLRHAEVTRKVACPCQIRYASRLVMRATQAPWLPPALNC